MTPLISIDEAQQRVLERVRRLPAERIPLESAAGRVLAEAARAAVDLPPFPSSAMDGYAVRCADVPGVLPVVARVAAGLPAERSLGPDETMAIATGGVVPEGADAVVPIEDVVMRDETVEFPGGAAAGANVRPAGGDVAAGDVVVPAGERLTPARIGALAAAGVADVEVARRPRAAVLATGTELRTPGEELGPGEIYDSNGVMLASALEAAHLEVELLPRAADDEEAHRIAIERGLGADVLVTTGGVSVGPHDLVRRVEDEFGVEEVFWGVAVKPGKPVSFGVRDATLVFGLPGNPVSSLVALELFVLPAVRALQGLREPLPPELDGLLAAPVRLSPAREQLLRARVRRDGGRIALDPVRGQESHMIARAASADALVRVPRGEGELAAGTPVRWLALG